MTNLRKVKFLVLLSILILSFSLLTGCGSDSDTNKDTGKEQETTITIAGSTSVAPYAEKIAREFEIENRGIKVNVQGLGSTAGVKAASEKTSDIGMSSRDLNDEEKGLGLDEHVIAHEGIAVITHPSNSVKDLELETIKKIFKGEIKNWKEVGGADKAIVLVSREAGSGTRGAFDALVGLEKKKGDKKISTVSVDALIADGNGAVKQNISGKENAIGYISLGYVDKFIGALKIDGVEPTVENVISKTYKISRPFLLLTKGEVNDATGAYLDFVMSEKGQMIIEKEGAVPIK